MSAIQDLLEGFETRVDSAEPVLRELIDQLDAAATLLHNTTERLFQLYHTVPSESTGESHKHALSRLREQYHGATTTFNGALDQLKQAVAQFHENVQLLVANVIVNHLCKGTQSVPRFVTSAYEETAVAFDGHNPLLAPQPQMGGVPAPPDPAGPPTGSAPPFVATRAQ